MSKKKKMVLIILASLAGAAAVAGIGFAIRHSVRNSRVIVVSAQEQADYEGEGDEISDIEGVISSGASQSIYLTEDMPVKEVKVKEGQRVKKGDVLLVYDTTKAAFAVEKEELNVKSVENAIQITERNIRTLQTMKPVSDDEEETETDPEDSEEETEQKKTTPKKKTSKKKTEKDPYKDVRAVSVLTDQSKAYNDRASEKNLGTESNPYRFLCREDARIKASFIQTMKAKAVKAGKSRYFVIEVRVSNKASGALKMMWMHEAGQLPDVDDDWEGTLEFAARDDEKNGDANPRAQETALNSEGSSPRIVLLADELDEDDTEAGDEEDDTGSDYVETISGDEEMSSEEIKSELSDQRENLEDYKLDLKEAQLKLKKAKGALAKGEAKANADGIVKVVGDPKNPPKDGAAFLQIGSAKGWTVRAAISERKLGKIKSGDKVQVRYWEDTLTATVDDISPYPDSSGMFSEGDSAASFYPFTAILEDSDAELTEGDSVEVFLSSGSDTENADGSLYVMKAFVRDDDEGKYVLKRGKGGKLEKQRIKVGKSSGYAYEILSGITTEDWIAFPYGKNAAEGAKTREGTLGELYEM